MSVNYVVYDLNGNIIRNGTTSSQDLSSKIQSEGEFILEGVGSPSTHKVVDGILVEKTQLEQEDYQYQMIELSYPPISNFNAPDEEIDQIINDYFMGRVDVSQWKLNHYAWLRKNSYPDIGDQLDEILKYLQTKDDLPSGLQSIISNRMSIKSKFIKTQEE